MFFCHSCFIGDSESIPDPEIQLVASGTNMEDNMALPMPIKIIRKKPELLFLLNTSHSPLTESLVSWAHVLSE